MHTNVEKGQCEPIHFMKFSSGNGWSRLYLLNLFTDNNKLGIHITKTYSHWQAGIGNDRLIMIGRQTHEGICLLKEKSCKGIRFDPEVPKSSSDSGGREQLAFRQKATVSLLWDATSRDRSNWNDWALIGPLTKVKATADSHLLCIV